MVVGTGGDGWFVSAMVGEGERGFLYIRYP